MLLNNAFLYILKLILWVINIDINLFKIIVGFKIEKVST